MKMTIKITQAEIRELVAKALGIQVCSFTLAIEPEEPIHTSLSGLGGVVSTVPPPAAAPLVSLPYLACLDGYDWAEVFGEGTGGNCTIIRPDGPVGSDVSLAPFQRCDVEYVVGQEEGENDGADWIVWGKLKDGRYFIARGGCDYTGWDCQAGNSGNVANTELQLITFGMSEDERKRFKRELPGDDKSKPVTSR